MPHILITWVKSNLMSALAYETLTTTIIGMVKPKNTTKSFLQRYIGIPDFLKIKIIKTLSGLYSCMVKRSLRKTEAAMYNLASK